MSNKLGKKIRSASSKVNHNLEKRREKNVIPGTAELKRSSKPVSTQKPVGSGGKYSEGSYVGGYLGLKKYGKKSGGSGGSKNIDLSALFENVSKDIWPNAHPKTPGKNDWKRR